MAKLSAFGDEAVDDFLGQVKFLAGEKVGYIEPRFLNKKNIIDLSLYYFFEPSTCFSIVC